ncbi:MAG TPA: FkbM family methyltransferase [Polyangia bacterium]|nr:FkbM family methyltransferase [Polyangia bacterium]
MRPDWLDTPRVVGLSSVGFPDDQEPLQIEVTPREMINRAIFLYGTFEISETRLVQAFLQPGMTFLDVGAHIGYYTLIAARLVGDAGHVHSFEPGKEMRAHLEANVARNGLRNVEIHPQALAERTGEVGFYPSELASNQGISSIIASGDGRAAPVTVPSFSLDDFAASLGGRRIDFLKMDIEGAELQVIRGGRRLLGEKEAPPMIFEAHELAPVADALRPLGYQIRQLHYTLENGLELPDAEAHIESLFAAYEAPNYFAAKDESVFDQVLARANSDRSPLFRLLGRL